jgi:hypothetical protein
MQLIYKIPVTHRYAHVILDGLRCEEWSRYMDVQQLAVADIIRCVGDLFLPCSAYKSGLEYMSHDATMVPVLPLPPLQWTATTLSLDFFRKSSTYMQN